jgi:hypothetical protein
MAADPPRNIAPGDTPTKPTSKPETVKLSEKLRDQLEKRFDDEGNFGTHAGPSEAAVRRLLKQGLAAGLSEKQVSNFLHPGFYRGAADPYGGGKLFKDLTPEQLTALSEYAGKQRGSGLGANQSATASQAAFFEAFPDLQAKYVSLANVYNKAPSATDGMSTTPPNAVLGSDGKWHDPTQDLPAGVTLPGYTPPAAPATDSGTGDGGLYQPFTQMTPEQNGVPGYPLTTYADYGSAMTAAQGMIANHYASAAAAGDFDTAGKAFGALQQHNDMMGPVAPAAPMSPNSFSERDLYQESQSQ